MRYTKTSGVDTGVSSDVPNRNQGAQSYSFGKKNRVVRKRLLYFSILELQFYL